MTYRGFGRPALVAPEAGPICESLWRWHLGGGASQTRESTTEAEALGALVLAPARDGDEAERMGAAYSLGGCGDRAALAVLATGSLSLSLPLSPSLSLSLPPPTHPPTLSLSLACTHMLTRTHPLSLQRSVRMTTSRRVEPGRLGSGWLETEPSPH